MVVMGFLYIVGIILGPIGMMGHNKVKEAIVFAIVHSVIMIGGIYLLNKLYKKLL